MIVIKNNKAIKIDVKVLVFSTGKYSSLGFVTLNGKFECFSLEDTYQTKKIKGITRIERKKYDLGIRDEGGFHERYKERFPEFHKGMIEVLNVPLFKYILIHCGNYDKDTDGCLLVGQQAITNQGYNRGAIYKSVNAYKILYKKLIDSVIAGLATIEYIDIEKKININS